MKTKSQWTEDAQRQRDENWDDADSDFSLQYRLAGEGYFHDDGWRAASAGAAIDAFLAYFALNYKTEGIVAEVRVLTDGENNQLVCIAHRNVRATTN